MFIFCLPPGLHLPKDVQDQVKALKKRASDIGIDYNKNVNDENTILEFAEAELGKRNRFGIFKDCSKLMPGLHLACD